MDNQNITSPKLVAVMDEIKQVLNKHDMGAIIILYEPGETLQDYGKAQHYMKFDPSYTITKIQSDSVYYFSTKDDTSTPEVKTKKVKDTANMFRLFKDALEYVYYAVSTLSRQMDQAANAAHGPSKRLDG